MNKGRKVTGTLRGYDQFMNIVLGDAVEELSGSGSNKIGMVVSIYWISFLCASFDYAPLFFIQVVRGNSIVQVNSFIIFLCPDAHFFHDHSSSWSIEDVRDSSRGATIKAALLFLNDFEFLYFDCILS